MPRVYGLKKNVKPLLPREEFQHRRALFPVAFFLYALALIPVIGLIYAGCQDCRLNFNKFFSVVFESDNAIALLTLIALIVAVLQLRQNAKQSRESYARDAWLRYLEIGLEHPLFHSTDSAIASIGASSASDLLKLETSDSERYFWFVDIMLEASERMLLFSEEKFIEDTVLENLNFHLEAIKLTWESQGRFYSDTLRSMVDQAIYLENQSSVGTP